MQSKCWFLLVTVTGTAGCCMLPTFIMDVCAKFQLEGSENVSGIFSFHSTDPLTPWGPGDPRLVTPEWDYILKGLPAERNHFLTVWKNLLAFCPSHKFVCCNFILSSRGFLSGKWKRSQIIPRFRWVRATLGSNLPPFKDPASCWGKLTSVSQS